MKTLTLNSRIFIQTFKSKDDLIEWLFEWNGIIYHSAEFEKLIIKQYCLN